MDGVFQLRSSRSNAKANCGEKLALFELISENDTLTEAFANFRMFPQRG